LNVETELLNYVYKETKDGKTTNKPIDDYNHCFIGNTLVYTKQGNKPIKDIDTRDKVLTSKGYRKVLLKHNNGLKQVNKYWLQYDTNVVELECTPTHRIKTTKGWKAISKLQSGDEIYLNNTLMAKDTHCTPKKDTSQEVQRECIELSGNISMGKSQKTCTSITSTKTPGTTESRILNLYKRMNIYLTTQKDGLEKTLNGLKNFMQQVLRKLKIGTDLQKVERGIVKMGKNAGLVENTQNLTANFVEKNMRQDVHQVQNTVTKTVKLKHVHVELGKNQEVFDITVEDAHEYFANGVLVHNCLDATRYITTYLFQKDKEI
jgi:hypothetical protein